MRPAQSQHRSDLPVEVRLAGWRRLLPIRVFSEEGVRRFRFRWRYLGAIVAAFALAGYFGGVGAAFFFIKYSRGFSEVAFVDLAWPPGWAHYRVASGEHLIALGQKQLAAGNPRGAFASLRLGVAKAPGSRLGRQLLHELFLAGRRHDLARKVLLDGLPFLRTDPVYLQTVFGFLLQQQEDDRVRRLGYDLLGSGQLGPEAAGLASLAVASAHYFRGNYDQAEDVLHQQHLTQTHDGRLLAAQIEWERGYRDLALLRLRALAEDFPTSEPCQEQLGSWLRETGARAEYRRFCLTRRIANPMSPAPRIALLYALREEGDPSGVAAEIEALIRDFPRDATALLALAEFAANTGNPSLARRATQLGLAAEAAAFLQVEAFVVAGDFRGALDLTRELLDSHPDWAKRHHALLNSLQAIACFGLHDAASAHLYLENFLRQTDLRADNLLAVAQRFVDVGARDEARRVLARAVAVDPLNQAALTRLVALELDLGLVDALPPDLRRLAAMRKPSPTVLRAASARLGSDVFLFSRERDAALQAVRIALAAAPRAAASP